MSVNIDVTKAGVPQKGTAPYILAQSGIPVLLPATTGSSISAGGVITLGTAIPNYGAGTGLWVYLMAGDVVGGTEGMYYATFTDTTHVQVKTNYVDVTNASTYFIPYIPASPTNAVGKAGALTANTGADRTLASVLIPGGAVGNNGFVKNRRTYSFSTTGTKSLKVLLGATTVNNEAALTNTYQAFSTTKATTNRGAQAVNYTAFGGSWSTDGASTANPSIYSTVDTSTDQKLATTAVATNAADNIVLEGFTVEIQSS